MVKSSTPGCTGGYSYWALSEPFVIIHDVQNICMETRNDTRFVNKGGDSRIINDSFNIYFINDRLKNIYRN